MDRNFKQAFIIQDPQHHFRDLICILRHNSRNNLQALRLQEWELVSCNTIQAVCQVARSFLVDYHHKILLGKRV